MDPSALAGLCALLSRAEGPSPQALRLGCAAGPSATSPARPQSPAAVARLVDPEAREAIARVSFAEAGNQGDSGLAGVVYTILNRLQDGRWGVSVDAVVNARGQFEPVTRAGGDWRRLPALSAAQLARIDTILNLAMDGRLPDLTNGARFFQNPVIVARRESAGQVSPGLVDFGGSPASAVIGAHRFYVSAKRGGGVENPREGRLSRPSCRAIERAHRRGKPSATLRRTRSARGTSGPVPCPIRRRGWARGRRSAVTADVTAPPVRRRLS